MRKPSAKKVEERIYFDTKYGPLTINQKGANVKELNATLAPVENKHVLENVRVSLHLERYEGLEPFLEKLKCKVTLPEFGYELNYDAHGAMKLGFTHGTAVVAIERIVLDSSDIKDTVMDIEFFLDDNSVTKITLPVKVPATQQSA